jgi:hypothetical protein
VLQTDASKWGWGGFVVDKVNVRLRGILDGPLIRDRAVVAAKGIWSEIESSVHINLLEIRAIRLCLLSPRISQVVRDKCVRVMCDNTTAVQSIN